MKRDAEMVMVGRQTRGRRRIVGRLAEIKKASRNYLQNLSVDLN